MKITRGVRDRYDVTGDSMMIVNAMQRRDGTHYITLLLLLFFLENNVDGLFSLNEIISSRSDEIGVHFFSITLSYGLVKTSFIFLNLCLEVSHSFFLKSRLGIRNNPLAAASAVPSSGKPAVVNQTRQHN